ncbi:MAG: phosphoglucosamine mutase [Pseudomonadota bacterium]
MKRKYFGTDGIRGRVGTPQMSADFVLKLGWAAGRVLASDNGSQVLIGKDTRISGYMFESALEAGLSAAGVDTRMLGPLPTPAIAYLTQTLRCQAGIVVSASHNPYYDNGIKFLGPDGGKLPDELEEAIEAELEKELTTVESAALGKVRRVTDASGRYIEFCKSTFPGRASLKGLKLVVDCAHGASYLTAPSVFSELGAEVVAIGVEPDGVNINLDCGATAPEALSRAVVEHGADAGIALDGDGDRVIMVDADGRILDGDDIIYLIAMHRHKLGALEGGVVGTLMSNLGLELALKEQGVPFARARVGDRFVMQRLRREAWQLGAEPSGHVICLHASPSGDGIVAALQVLAAMVESGDSLSQLGSGLQKLPQTMINVPTPGRVDIDDYASIQDAVSQTELALGETGRVLLRPSGTEPLVRVMLEGRDARQIETLCESLAGAVEDALKNAGRH